MLIKKVIKKPVKKSVTKPADRLILLQKKAKEIGQPTKATLSKVLLAGKVLHYFNNVKVAVIKFKEPIKIGDTIRIVGGEAVDFKQKIASIQIDHKKVAIVKKGQEVGVKVKEKVREGYRVYKV